MEITFCEISRKKQNMKTITNQLFKIPKTPIEKKKEGIQLELNTSITTDI